MNPGHEPYDGLVGAYGRKEAAKYLSISTRLLDKLAGEGRLVRTKIGSKSVFLLEDLDHFLQSCRDSSQEETP